MNDIQRIESLLMAADQNAKDAHTQAKLHDPEWAGDFAGVIFALEANILTFRKRHSKQLPEHHQHD